jgi:hypothetical protein
MRQLNGEFESSAVMNALLILNHPAIKELCKAVMRQKGSAMLEIVEGTEENERQKIETQQTAELNALIATMCNADTETGEVLIYIFGCHLKKSIKNIDQTCIGRYIYAFISSGTYKENILKRKIEEL